MEETLREATPTDSWRDALAQTIDQQRRRVGERIAGQRQRLRDLEARIAAQLDEATQKLRGEQDQAHATSVAAKAQEATVKQRTDELKRRETEITRREQDLGAALAESDRQEKKLLDDLSRRVADLDSRHSSLAAESQRLAGRQAEISRREAELDQLQAGLAGQSAAHQDRADELARQQADFAANRKLQEAESQRLQLQLDVVHRQESELHLKSLAVAERERETLRQRRHVAQQLRARKHELTAEVELHRAEALASGAGQEIQLQLRLTELQAKYDRLKEEFDKGHKERDGASQQVTDLQAQLEAKRQESQKQHVALEQAQRRQTELEAERKKLQGDLARTIDESSKHAEARAADLARRTSDAQGQAAEVARLTAELQRVQRESQEQLQRLRAEQGKSHDAQLQSLQAQVGDLNKKLADEHARFEKERKELTGQVATANEALASGGDAAKELAKLREEHKQLETWLAEADEKAKQAASAAAAGGGGQELDDLRRRFEMAVQDVRELKTKNSDLTEQLTKARQGGGGAATAAAGGGGSDWESMKKQMLAQLARDFDDDDEQQKANKLTVEGAIKITDDVVAEKEHEIQELRKLLESQAQNVGEVAVGAAAIAEVLDSDELVRQERDTLKQLQDSLREQLKKAEIDISLERAKLARERTEMDEKLRVWESDRTQHGGAAEGGQEKAKKGGGRKWLTRLGLGDKGD